MIVSRELSVRNSPLALFYVHPERHSPLSVLNWSKTSITGWHNFLASVAAYEQVSISLRGRIEGYYLKHINGP